MRQHLYFLVLLGELAVELAVEHAMCISPDIYNMLSSSDWMSWMCVFQHAKLCCVLHRSADKLRNNVAWRLYFKLDLCLLVLFLTRMHSLTNNNNIIILGRSL